MSTVYVSSTFLDLYPCRQQINEAIRKLKHVDISMEHYTASTTPTVTQCLMDVASCDVYIGVFARRYGWIPPGENVSITELELKEAVSGSKLILLFLLDNNVNDWPQPNDEPIQSKEKLATLTENLQNGMPMPIGFDSCHNLIVKMMAALANLLYPVPISSDIERENKLLKLLENDNLITQSRAKEELIAMNSQQYATKLFWDLNDHSLSVQQQINNLENFTRIRSLGGNIMPYLRSLLTNINPAIVAWVIAAIGREGNAGKQISIDTVNTILNLYNNPSNDIRKEVAHAMYKLPYNAEIKEKMITCLEKLASSKEDSVIASRAMYSIQKLRNSFLTEMPNLGLH